MNNRTDAVDILEGNSYRLKFPWVGVVNRSQQDINKRVDMTSARRKEREYFSNSREYYHMASKMGSEYLAKMLSKHLEGVKPTTGLKPGIFENDNVCVATNRRSRS